MEEGNILSEGFIFFVVTILCIIFLCGILVIVSYKNKINNLTNIVKQQEQTISSYEEKLEYYSFVLNHTVDMCGFFMKGGE